VAAAVSLKLSSQEMASDAELTRRAVSSAYVHQVTECIAADYYLWLHRHVPKDPVDGDAEVSWCKNTALPHAGRCLETLREILTETDSASVFSWRAAIRSTRESGTVLGLRLG